MNLKQRLISAILVAAVTISAARGGVLTPGMPLAEAIEQFRADGLVIVYSSDLIKPDMQIGQLRPAGSSREQLAALLSDFSLRIQAGPEDSLLIVRSAPEKAAGQLAGLVRDASTGMPIAGAEVFLGNGRYRVVTDRDGNFLFNELAPGRYRLRVVYETTNFAQRERAEVLAGQTTSLALEMDGISQAGLDEIVVSTSQYQFDRDSVDIHTSYSASNLEILPNVGDDPLRAVAQLPGSATTDFSARTNIRGGNTDENQIRMDGFRLYNPYHFKSLQGLFSAVDPRLVNSLDIFTGGFDVTRGDVMSSIVDVTVVQPEQDTYREVSASFFNLSGQFAQRFNNDRTHGLLSARRGNLNWILKQTDPKLGKPKYFDVFARLGHSVNDELEIAGSFLLIDDNISIADSDEEEFAEDNHRDSYYWLKFDLTPNDDWSGNVLLSRADLESNSGGVVAKVGATTGEQSTLGSFTIDSLETNWSWWFADDWLLQFGGEIRNQKGTYFYRDNANFDLLFTTPGAATDPIRQNNRHIAATGEYYMAYSSIRRQWSDRLTTEFGLRWNKETLSLLKDSSLDPRIGMLYEFSPATRGRINLGRFSQSQTIDQLNFADGEFRYNPLEHVNQVVISMDHDFSPGLNGRIEFYYKNYKNLRPRYENFLDTYTLLPQLWPDRIGVFAQEATATGAEVTLRHDSPDALGWWLSYGWSRAEDVFPGADIERSWDQRYTLGGGVEWRTDTWELSLSTRLHEGRPTTSTTLGFPGPPASINTGQRNDIRLNSYFTLDARVARLWEFDNSDELTVFFEVRNLTNQDNPCCVLYEALDDNGTIDYQTDIEFQIPIFPSLGFIWQF